MCSEKNLMLATQVAYSDTFGKVRANKKADGQEGSFTIRELISSSFDTDAARNLAIEAGVPEDKITLQDLIKYSDLPDSEKSIFERFSSDILDWKITDIHDTRISNGFYVSAIETSDTEAIVAFRGSKDMKKMSNLINDWLKADIALLNSDGTVQQEEAEQYCDKIIRSKLFQKYKTIYVVGHSLGGNLATHFTISAAKKGREALFEKIARTINFDGPGVSEEYIEAYKKEIPKAAPKLKHLKWSAVGDLLFDIPGEQTEFLAIDEELHKDNPIERIKYKIITRHSTMSVMFDEEGNAIRGKQDGVSKALSVISKSLDVIIPAKLTRELYAAADWLFEKILMIRNKIEGIDIKFADISWSERAAQKGSILGRCVEIVNSTINVFKEGVSALRDEINEIFCNANYLPNPNFYHKLAYADVSAAAGNLNISGINRATEIFRSEIGDRDIEM